MFEKPSKIPTPSAAYGERRFDSETLSFVEKHVAHFYPRRGLIRIDESKPNMEAAMAALLNPVYDSLRKYGKTEFEIEISIRAHGSITKRPVGYEKVKEDWKSKSELWRNDEALSKHRGAL
jgi:hypothetical protein